MFLLTGGLQVTMNKTSKIKTSKNIFFKNENIIFAFFIIKNIAFESAASLSTHAE
jgi:hypothetical protein